MNLLDSQKEEWVKEIEGMKQHRQRSYEPIITLEETLINTKANAVNEILDAVVSKLKGKEVR